MTLVLKVTFAYVNTKNTFCYLYLSRNQKSEFSLDAKMQICVTGHEFMEVEKGIIPVGEELDCQMLMCLYVGL